MEGSGLEVRVLNVYGPYVNNGPFWESLLKNSLIKVDNMILGGDINFSLGEVEIWGPNSQPDHQTDLFDHIFSPNGLINISPLKLLHT
jgi:hypothetical protein